MGDVMVVLFCVVLLICLADAASLRSDPMIVRQQANNANMERMVVHRKIPEHRPPEPTEKIEKEPPKVKQAMVVEPLTVRRKEREIRTDRKTVRYEHVEEKPPKPPETKAERKERLKKIRAELNKLKAKMAADAARKEKRVDSLKGILKEEKKKANKVVGNVDAGQLEVKMKEPEMPVGEVTYEMQKSTTTLPPKADFKYTMKKNDKINYVISNRFPA
eukprot:gnl/TRDRNA2_/TRDRNA2_39686_c0_seq1.p1 gnl/TRDRNA2_/TRDRNA2_39686_c0~~gnl/TRDRNA2_/TRDRNA2_39686_c0_seq1.p1  ORF type:complete len:218 (-),score=63.29 gnl/TRDRNA2_/TRDRNA2_39686_c0_seq1:14-667(-)